MIRLGYLTPGMSAAVERWHATLRPDPIVIDERMKRTIRSMGMNLENFLRGSPFITICWENWGNR